MNMAADLKFDNDTAADLEAHADYLGPSFEEYILHYLEWKSVKLLKISLPWN